MAIEENVAISMVVVPHKGIKAETRHKFPLNGFETPVVIFGGHPISACLLPMV